MGQARRRLREGGSFATTALDELSEEVGLLEVRWFDRDDLPAPLMHSSAVAFAHHARYLETGIFQVG